jgi:hypothetical protein
MPNRKNLLVALALVAPLALIAAKPDKPKKDKGPFVAANPPLRRITTHPHLMRAR